jgi:hypothetical protein
MSVLYREARNFVEPIFMEFAIEEVHYNFSILSKFAKLENNNGSYARGSNVFLKPLQQVFTRTKFFPK